MMVGESIESVDIPVEYSTVPDVALEASGSSPACHNIREVKNRNETRQKSAQVRF